MDIKKVNITPFTDQKMGTSGLRKKVEHFMQEHYLESFVQSVFDTLGADSFKGKILVIGGDGRYYNKKAIQIIIKMAVANGWGRLIIGQNGIMSTPAVSLVIRKYKAEGGFILSASHNMGGPGKDFGIKYNMSNGSSTPEKVTSAMYETSKNLSSYTIAEMEDIDISQVSSFSVEGIEINVIDSVADYAEMMQELFDFDAIKALFKSGFKMKFDAMHAVTGPYAKAIFEGLLGAEEGTVVNCIPKEDFNGGHPDPNPVYAKELYDLMMSAYAPDFAAASDGDGDRNMVLGKDCFISPSDSLAVIVDNYQLVKGYKGGILGVARTLPTSRALDLVAEKLGVDCYEVPTGWRFFGTLLDAGKITFCGEESFGSGSNHIREKDGVWAVLYWLNIIAVRKESAAEIMHKHWQKYGRHYYCRYDYEAINSNVANDMMAAMREKVTDLAGKKLGERVVKNAKDFRYVDPVDGYVSEHQGISVEFQDGSRFVVRLSGTGTVGATMRLYMEKYETAPERLLLNSYTVLSDIAEIAVAFTDVQEKAAKAAPDVIV